MKSQAASTPLWDETLRALNITPDFIGMPDKERLSLLVELLSAPLPELAEHPGVTQPSAETFCLVSTDDACA